MKRLTHPYSLIDQNGQALIETLMACGLILTPILIGISTLYYQGFKKFLCERNLFEVSRDMLDRHADSASKTGRSTLYRNGVRLDLLPRAVRGEAFCGSERVSILLSQPPSFALVR